jgi:phenylpropionate dioxygenase-like ring-hydroxylating dioxygenase large terminal subunit
MANYTKATLPDVPFSSNVWDILDSLDSSLGGVEKALALPADCYTSDEWFEFERRAIFDRDWLVLGHHNRIPEPGDYMSVHINGEPLLVVRGQDDQIRVMSGVCRHRGHLLGGQSGNTTSFTCPFHGWSYDLEGTLTGAPEMNGTLPFAELQRTACLPVFRSEIWNGFIFVNLSGEAAPLAPRLKGLTKMVANYHMEDLAAGPTVDWADNPWNWKFMQENALEPYHTRYLHSGIHDFAPSDRVRWTEWDPSDDAAIYRAVGFTHIDGGFNLANKALFPALPTLTLEERQQVVFAGVMPNLFLGCTPDVVFYYLIMPQGAGKITLRVGVLTTYENLALPTADLLMKGTVEGVGVYNDQDTQANTQTHIGMQSRVAPRSRWSPNEKTLWQLNEWLIKRYKAYGDELRGLKMAAE